MSDRSLDLFVIHAPDNRAWVQGFLLPRLGLPTVSVRTSDNLDLGKGKVGEIERLVEQSRFTVLILSPAFLADAWVGLGEQLISTAAATDGEQRLIPLILEPCTLPLRLSFRVMLDCTDQDEWEAAVGRLRELLQQPAPPDERITCPYPGMAPFSEQQAKLFFGRDDEIERMSQHFRDQRLLCVIGPSGSGKSSLVRAGLVPALAETTLFAPGFWRVVVMRPGSQPQTELATLLAGDPLDPTTVGKLIQAVPAAQRLLVVIDQLEEAFTLAAPEAQKSFFAAIQALRQNQQCALIFTMRADFYGKLLESPLWPLDQSQIFNLAPLQGDGLREALQHPARRVGVYLEQGLVECLVDDADNQPGALPLVQETMQLLWADMQGRLVTLQSYQKLGEGSENGLAVAVARKADAALAELSPADQEIARRVFLRLVQFGEGHDPTRRQQPLGKLEGNAPAAVDAVVNRLTEARLLTISDDPRLTANVAQLARTSTRVDLAHEALIDGWPRLQEWLHQGQADELTRRRLEQAAEDWDSHGRDSSFLLSGRRLQEAEQWSSQHQDQTDHLSQELLAASQQATKQTGRRRQVAIGGAVAALALVIAGALAYPSLNEGRLRRQTLALNSVVALPAGKLVFGAARPNPDWAEAAQQDVDLPAFRINEHEISNQEFGLCLKAGVCHDERQLPMFLSADTAAKPVARVTALQASEFCNWLGGTLPTSQQWERAARGPNGNEWPWGNQPADRDRANINAADPTFVALKPIESYPDGRSPEGVYDLIGNAEEWTATVIDSASGQTTTWDGSASAALQVRGGAADTAIPRVTAARAVVATGRDNALGFRCALDQP